MEIKNLEEQLIKMRKPTISQLRHQDMLAKAITSAKDKSVLSGWWLSIPLYILATLLMKSYFMPSTTLFSNLHELAKKMKYSSILFLFVIPVVFILINFISIRKVYFYSSNPKTTVFIKAIWFNILIMFASLIILIIYF
jgi:hypothetical protein